MTSDDKKNPNALDIDDSFEAENTSPMDASMDDDLVVDFEIEGGDAMSAADIERTSPARGGREEEETASPLSKFVEMSEEEDHLADDADDLYGEEPEGFSGELEDVVDDADGYGDDFEDDFGEYEEPFDGENGDDDFEYEFPDEEDSGARFKVGLMPAMLVLLAVGAGGYMVLNPQLLPGASKTNTVSQMSVEEAVSSVAQVSEILESEPPQPNVNVNTAQGTTDTAGDSGVEIPRGPQVSEDFPVDMGTNGFGADSARGDDIAAGVTPDSWQRDGDEFASAADGNSGMSGLSSAFGADDQSEESGSGGFEVVDVSDIPDTAGAIDVTAPEMPEAVENGETVDNIATFDDVSEDDAQETAIDIAAAPVEEVDELDMGASQNLAPEVTESPDVVEAAPEVMGETEDSPVVESVDVDTPAFPEQIAGQDEGEAPVAEEFPDIENLQQDVAEAAQASSQGAEQTTGQMPGQVEGQADKRTELSAREQPAQAFQSDTYYDSQLNAPSGQLQAQTNLPRKIDPTQEPASKFIIVKQAHEKDSLESQIVAAGRALKLKRYDSAAELYDRLYERVPQDTRVLMGRAVAYQNLGHYDRALKLYEELLDKQPENTEALVNTLGILRQQYPEVALRRLKLLHESHPGKTAILAQIGVTEADMGNYAEAIRYLGAAASQEPHNAKHMFNMAIVADRAGQVSKAIGYYEQALEIDSVYGGSKTVPREQIYDRLSVLRRR